MKGLLSIEFGNGDARPALIECRFDQAGEGFERRVIDAVVENDVSRGESGLIQLRFHFSRRSTVVL